jgi:23S rRNA (cytosine1962-C5)-methyltransferase
VKRIALKPGREKSLVRRHPWIFSGAIEQPRDVPEAGETVTIVNHRGEFLAYAAYSPQSQIRARVWSFDARARIDATFMSEALRRSIEYRKQVVGPDCDAIRLVHAESDGLPGLIVDRYADTAVIQCSSSGAELWRDVFAEALIRYGGCTRVFERSDAEVRKLEGLDSRVGVVRGDPPPESVLVREGSARFMVDVRQGQKTGFFLDQRDNRAQVLRSSRGREVLDAFCYTGGFSVAALLGGACSVTALDSSAGALEQARANVQASGFANAQLHWIEGDAFATLRRLYDQGRRFDLVVLDPPKFAPTEKHVPRAARAYKDVNLWALRLLRPGGLLFTFSCSGGVGEALFQSIVAGAALDAKVDCRIVGRLSAAADHPVALNFPEGAYLKGLVLALYNSALSNSAPIDTQ